MWHLEVLYTKAHSDNKCMKILSTFCPLEPSSGKCQQRSAQLKHDLQFFSWMKETLMLQSIDAFRKMRLKNVFIYFTASTSVPTNEVIIYKCL